jgi:hypothetical protein
MIFCRLMCSENVMTVGNAVYVPAYSILYSKTAHNNIITQTVKKKD